MEQPKTEKDPDLIDLPATLRTALEEEDFETAIRLIAAASGTGSVAIGGDVSGTTITTNAYSLTLSAAAARALRRELPGQIKRPLNNLPPVQPHFTGRTEERARLLQALTGAGTSQAISALHGMGGIGKTELALHVAHQAVLHFPAAQLIFDLKGTSPSPLSPRAVMAAVIARFETEAKLPDDDTAIAELYGDLLKRHKCLLILDNAADDVQVAPLLPPAPSAAIVTSRPLIPLPDVPSLRLDVMGRGDAGRLLATILDGKGAAADEIDRLAAACLDHPLSLRVAGAFLRDRWQTWTPDRFIASITANRATLRLGNSKGLDVMASLSLSLSLLTDEDPSLAERWRDLSVFAGDFDADAAAAVWGLGADDGDNAVAPFDMLARLTELAFLDPGAGRGHFAMHDLMRDLAGLDQQADRFQSPGLRHAAYYCDLLEAIDQQYLAGQAVDALSRFDRAWPNMEAGQAFAVACRQQGESANRIVLRFPGMGVHVLSLRLHARAQIDWLTRAVDVAREIHDRCGESNNLGNLGNAHAALGDTRKAIDCHEQALAISREIHDRRGEGANLGNLGNAHAALGDARKAIGYYEQALAIFRETNDRRGEGACLGNLGIAHAALGDTRKAIDCHEQALAISREIHDRRGEGANLGNLGIAHFALGDARKAIDYYAQDLAIFREINDRCGEGNSLGNFGLAHAALGDARKAIDCHKQALAIAREINDKRGEGNHLGNLGTAHFALGDARKAIDYLEQALAIAREINDRRGEGTRLGNLGNAHAALGDARKAIDCHEQALAIAREINDRRGEGNRLGDLGNAHADLGDAHQAIAYLEQAETILEEIGDIKAAQVRNRINQLSLSDSSPDP